MSEPEDEPFVSTDVLEESGRYTVVMDVVFPDGAVRHRLQTYHTRSRAEAAAKMFYRTAEREAPPGWGM